MIEVEIKVKVTDEQIDKLKDGAKFVSVKSFTDEYYDSADFVLTTNGMWLRRRDGQFELKYPATPDGTFHLEKNIPMHEVTDQQEIMRILNLSSPVDISEALVNAEIDVLYRLTTERQRYEKNGFVIDFDSSDFGDLVYQMCEIELTVESPGQVERAFETLYAFAGQHGLSTEKAPGKVGYYMYEKNPKHHYAVINSPKHQG